jgi:hypothetical protein
MTLSCVIPFLSLEDMNGKRYLCVHLCMHVNVLVIVMQDDSLRGGPEFVIVNHTIIY